MLIIEDSATEIGNFEHDIFTFTVNKIKSYSKNLINADDPWYLSKLKQSI